MHHEVEDFAKISKVENICQVSYYTTMTKLIRNRFPTARDVKPSFQSKGLPWEKSKGFDGSAVIETFIEKILFENIPLN
jgi:hypothetical protein